MAFWNTSVNYQLNVTFDITTYCNAGCPQCDRTSKNGLGKKSWIPLVQWTLEQFKEAIKPEDFKYIKTCAFTGSWGDPIMNKDIFEIVKYCVEHETHVQIETNGSIRDEEWWWNFGVMGGKYLQVRFDVDGIDQEMHHKYRRFTSLQKVLDNMYMFSQTDAITASQTVVFKHNQDYINDIEKLCRDWGSQFHTKVISDRFNDIPSFEFVNEHGEKETLEKADSSVFKKPFIPGAFKAETIKDKENIIATTEIKVEEARHADEKVLSLDNNIQCRWAFPRNAIYIQNNGTVIPCCYVGWVHERLMLNNPEENPWFEETHMGHPVWEHLMENEDDLNVFKHSLKDILNSSEWYTKVFPESIKGNNPTYTCELHCSNRIKKEHQLREDGKYVRK
jgi:MoaA/NifB/PqqE/SkfB family radical SAM enzyme